MIELDFRQRLKKDGPLLGMQCFTGSAGIVEILGGAGYDWVSLDMEHCPTDFALVEHLTRAANCAGITPLVRVAENSPVLIMKALDAGAAGVFIPHVSSRSDVERAVAASLYAPQGNRGACSTTRPAGYGAERWTDYVKRANESVVVIPLIEETLCVRARSQHIFCYSAQRLSVPARPSVKTIRTSPYASSQLRPGAATTS